MNPPRYALPALAAAATGVLVGAAMVATRSVASEITPGSLAFLRYVISSACLLPPFLLRHRARVPWRDACVIGALGVLQFAAVVVLLNLALGRSPSARVALLFALTPVLTLAIESAIRRHAPPALQLLGVVLAIAGVAVAFGWNTLTFQGPLLWSGEGASLLAALVAASCSLGYRPYLARHGALTVAGFALPPAVGVLLGAAALEGLFAEPLVLSAAGWGAVAFVGVGSAIGYLLWLWALNHASASRVTVFLTLNPIAAAGLGALYLGERVGVGFVLGVMCVVIGVWLAYRPLGKTKPEFRGHNT